MSPPIRLIGLIANPPDAGVKPVKYSNWIGQVCDISTVVVIPFFGGAFLNVWRENLAISYVWCAMVLFAMVGYFVAVKRNEVRSVEEEFLINGLLAAGVIINLTMPFVWDHADEIWVVNVPIAAQFLYAMGKRNQYLAYQLQSSDGVHEFAHEEILDYIKERNPNQREIVESTFLGQALAPTLRYAWPLRWLFYFLVGGLLFVAFMAIGSLVSSPQDAFNFFLYGPRSV
ncbi:hypothetical protein [Lewinella sp. 4G2]|uniref:hypothetical protein n=1 Tax=Lewinella sp. 4G2 TaxID=1803372 RepID=UPI0018D391E0|nr:hypothetical protein [Lewinella sp. 4G2]